MIRLGLRCFPTTKYLTFNSTFSNYTFIHVSRSFHNSTISLARNAEPEDDNIANKIKMNEHIEEHIVKLNQRRDELQQELYGASGGKQTTEFKFLTQLQEKWEVYLKLKTAVQELLSTMNDPNEDEEIKQIAKEEMSSQSGDLSSRENDLVMLLVQNEIAKYRDEEKGARNAILEVRPGTGGDEASLWAMEIFQMYEKYARVRGWRFEILSMHKPSVTSLREGIATVSASEGDTYERLRNESGVHRVQRVPATEGQGRVHTSTCSVVVLPELEEQEVKISPQDIRIDTFRSSGAGGQHVNVTDSAVRITHLPTGMQVSISDQRSQLQNKERAMAILRSRLHEIDKKKKDSERLSQRSEQIGTGDRSDKIRTYNFPQDRVTDHRVGLSLYDLDRMMEGEMLDELIDSMVDREVLDAYDRLMTSLKQKPQVTDKKKKK
jgi:peptide chain release factor 1